MNAVRPLEGVFYFINKYFKIQSISPIYTKKYNSQTFFFLDTWYLYKGIYLFTTEEYCFWYTMY